MESLNVKNINDEKIFNVIDPNGQGEVVNRIRPISISINQKAQTINDQTDSTINLAVYWNDTWKSILDLTFDESLRQEYGKLTQDLTNIQKDIDMKQYKDAETKTADFLKYVANLSSKYTAIPEKAVVSKIKNDFVKIKADRNSVKVAISDKLLNFMLKKYAKVNNLDYTKSNECFSTSKFNCLANNYDIYYHSPEIFQKQAYMTVVKDNKVVGSYKVNYDQFSKFASKFMLTPQKLGYSKDRLAGYMKTAEVVMQNIFFDSVDEAKEWQEMVDEKKKEQATTPEGEEETTETTTTETKTEMGEGKSESPVKGDGGLARPSEDFASDEIPESEPRQQEQQGGGQNLGASRRVKNVKKTAKVGYNAEPENMEEEVAIELADELMSAANVALEKAGLLWGGYSGEEQRRQRVDVQKNAIEPLLKGRLKESIQGKVIDLIKEHLTDLNYHTLVSAIEEVMGRKQASKKVKLNKKAEDITEIEENYKESDFNIKYKNLVIKDNAFVQGELKTETTRVKVEFVVYGYNIPNGMAEANFNCVVKPSKANATIPHIENYTISYDVVLDDETKKQLDSILYNLSNKKIQSFCKYNDKGYLVYKYQVAASKKVNLNKQAGIDMNLSYGHFLKEEDENKLPKFNTLEDIKTYIKTNNKFPGNFFYKGGLFTEDEYDMDGMVVTYGSPEIDKSIIINTPDNRYNYKGNYKNLDMDIVEEDAPYFRTDVNYTLPKKVYEELFPKKNSNKNLNLNKQARTVNSKQDIKQILKDKNAVEARNYGDFVSAIRENKTPVETIKAYGKKKTAGGYDEYVLVVYESGAYFYTELSNGKRVDEKYYKFENVEKQAENRKNYNVVIGFDGKEEESDFAQEDVISALQEALIYFGEKWHELPSSLDNIDKLDFVKIREIEKGETVKEYTKEDILKMKEDFPKYSCNKKALYGDVQEQDIVPAKTETKVYLQSSDKDLDKVWGIKMFVDNIDNKDGMDVVEFTKIGLIDHINELIEEHDSEHDYGNEKLDYNCSDDLLKEYVTNYLNGTVEFIKEAKNNQKVQKKAEETIEEKIELDNTIKWTIGVGDTVAIKVDNCIWEDMYMYADFIGKPLILMENDKEDINKVIVEQTEYPFQRMSIDKDKIMQYSELKVADVIVEDEDGDEMITTFEELPIVAKQCKIKSIHKAATKKKANLTKKAINSLEDVAVLIDTIVSDYDWYGYFDSTEVGELSLYDQFLADVQKDEKGTIEKVLKYIAEDDDGYTAPEVEQLKEYYNAKFGGK